MKDLYKSKSISDGKYVFNLENIPIDLEIFNATLLICSVHVKCLFKTIPKKLKLSTISIAVFSMSSKGLSIFFVCASKN